jgi:hypothetical protein
MRKIKLAIPAFSVLVISVVPLAPPSVAVSSRFDARLKEAVDVGNGYRPMRNDQYLDCAKRAVEAGGRLKIYPKFGTPGLTNVVFPSPTTVLPVARPRGISERAKVATLDFWRPEKGDGPERIFSVACSPSGDPLSLPLPIDAFLRPYDQTDADQIYPYTTIDSPALPEGLVEVEARGGSIELRHGFSIPRLPLCGQAEIANLASDCASAILITSWSESADGTSVGGRLRYPAPCSKYDDAHGGGSIRGTLHARPNILDKGYGRPQALLRVTWLDDDGEVVTESKPASVPCDKRQLSANFRTACTNFIRGGYASARNFAAARQIGNEIVGALIAKIPPRTDPRHSWASRIKNEKIENDYQKLIGVRVDLWSESVFGAVLDEGAVLTQKDATRALEEAQASSLYQYYSREEAGIDAGGAIWGVTVGAISSKVIGFKALDLFVSAIMSYGSAYSKYMKNKEIVKAFARTLDCAWVHTEAHGFPL